jgi:hypothetical protein
MEIEMLAGDPVEAERAASAVYEEYSQEPNWMSDRAAWPSRSAPRSATRYTEIAGARPGDQVMDPDHVEDRALASGRGTWAARRGRSGCT